MNLKEIRTFPFTYLFLGINSLVLLGMFLRYGMSYDSIQAVFDFGGLIGLFVKQYPLESWRLISAAFVHIGFVHFASNMASLYIFGRIAEGLYGSWRFFMIYLLSGLMGNLFVLFFDPMSLSAGASTSLFGIMAVLGSQYFLSKNPHLKMLGRSLFSMVAVNILVSFMPGISLFGHLGGLLGGLLAAFIFPLPTDKKRGALSRLLAWNLYLVLALLLYFL